VITLYLCFLAGGAVLPILSALFGFLGDGMDADIDADLDVEVGADIDPGLEVDTMFSIGLLPSSLMALSALAITFGAVGAIMSIAGKGKVITFVIALIAGYIASVFIQTIVKTLKKIQKRNVGIDENELLLYDGKVVDTILPGQLGTVSFVTLQEVRVSYPAKCSDAGLKLETGKIVKAIEIKDGIFIVEPKNKYE
jgi:hypothetical protein